MEKIHQGDVLLVEVDVLPKGLREVERTVVQYGEITGHAHKIAGARIFQGEAGKFVILKKASIMTHEDHPHVAVPAPRVAYQVHIQQEFFPYEKNGEEGFYEPIPD